MPPLRWGCADAARAGLVIAVPLVWLLVFFLIPFLVVAKISLSRRRSRSRPTCRWSSGPTTAGGRCTLNFGNFAYLFDDPLYLNAYLISLRSDRLRSALALLVGYPIAYYIARSPTAARRSC